MLFKHKYGPGSAHRLSEYKILKITVLADGTSKYLHDHGPTNDDQRTTSMHFRTKATFRGFFSNKMSKAEVGSLNHSSTSLMEMAFDCVSSIHLVFVHKPF